jgi:hypothetical protein
MPNTPDDWHSPCDSRESTVTLHDPERAAFWRGVLGTDTVPVIALVPQWLQLPGFAEPQLCFMLDLAALTPELRSRLIAGIAQRFTLERAEVEAELDAHGVPILFDNTSWESADFGLVINLVT